MFWQRAWYRRGVDFRLWLLLPLHWLFCGLSAVRRLLYSIGLLAAYRAPVPVIVVGNISVGGTGKTPVTEALIQWLIRQGLQPAIISRGYGGKGPFPQLVTAASSAAAVGDEPKLLATRTQVPLVVGANRQQAIELLLKQHPEVSVIVSDDGLQHYALARDIEVVVVDGQRGFGNGWRLPLGPLREPLSRLQHVDFIVQNGESPSAALAGLKVRTWRFDLLPGSWRRVNQAQGSQAESVTLEPGNYVAVAGIGNPQRFFDTVAATLAAEATIRVVETKAFADHHPFTAADFQQFNACTGVLMTEKDAAKCQPFAPDNWYYLPVSAQFETEFWQQFAKQLQTKQTLHEAARSTYGS
ncbi:tetraacyldisaccharide 4'-kinase [Pseudidiomarina woesei]|uniref:Tetraacyldisaccharide 4'-kinase n=1 Tax=Pseudidiomarina woesei TaxID=1381080 RepID=A0A0K6H2C1_9GAMM|nr:tetraacyldisaccharide 4'-kinase [Pseudidiomarina woesei]CUA84981.1 lipid-A-disaccharide kinase [Pseudidiomarina woesei]